MTFFLFVETLERLGKKPKKQSAQTRSAACLKLDFSCLSVLLTPLDAVRQQPCWFDGTQASEPQRHSSYTDFRGTQLDVYSDVQIFRCTNARSNRNNRMQFESANMHFIWGTRLFTAVTLFFLFSVMTYLQLSGLWMGSLWMVRCESLSWGIHNVARLWMAHLWMVRLCFDCG